MEQADIDFFNHKLNSIDDIQSLITNLGKYNDSLFSVFSEFLNRIGDPNFRTELCNAREQLIDTGSDLVSNIAKISEDKNFFSKVESFMTNPRLQILISALQIQRNCSLAIQYLQHLSVSGINNAIIYAQEKFLNRSINPFDKDRDIKTEEFTNSMMAITGGLKDPNTTEICTLIIEKVNYFIENSAFISEDPFHTYIPVRHYLNFEENIELLKKYKQKFRKMFTAYISSQIPLFDDEINTNSLPHDVVDQIFKQYLKKHFLTAIFANDAIQIKKNDDLNQLKKNLLKTNAIFFNTITENLKDDIANLVIRRRNCPIDNLSSNFYEELCAFGLRQFIQDIFNSKKVGIFFNLKIRRNQIANNPQAKSFFETQFKQYIDQIVKDKDIEQGSIIITITSKDPGFFQEFDIPQLNGNEIKKWVHNLAENELMDFKDLFKKDIQFTDMIKKFQYGLSKVNSDYANVYINAFIDSFIKQLIGHIEKKWSKVDKNQIINSATVMQQALIQAFFVPGDLYVCVNNQYVPNRNAFRTFFEQTNRISSIITYLSDNLSKSTEEIKADLRRFYTHS